MTNLISECELDQIKNKCIENDSILITHPLCWNIAKTLKYGISTFLINQVNADGDFDELELQFHNDILLILDILYLLSYRLAAFCRATSYA